MGEKDSEIRGEEQKENKSKKEAVVMVTKEKEYEDQNYQYIDGPRAGRPGFVTRQWKMILNSTSSRPNVGPTQPPIRWVPR
jgi:hypothetical protein